MILVLSGTGDGRKVVRTLKEHGYEVTATTVTHYGKTLLTEGEGVPVIEGGLTADDLKQLLLTQDIKAVVDATHPFAVAVSQMAMQVCRENNAVYIRYEREETEEPNPSETQTSNKEIFRVKTFAEAAKLAVSFPGNVFLTVGSNHLIDFCGVIPQERLVARVLPASGVLKKCEELGLVPRNLVAIQGPFSKNLNMELFKQYKAGVVVTKDSGRTGGVEDKIEAALELGIPVILVKRPVLEYPLLTKTPAELLELLRGVIHVAE